MLLLHNFSLSRKDHGRRKLRCEYKKCLPVVVFCQISFPKLNLVMVMQNIIHHEMHRVYATATKLIFLQHQHFQILSFFSKEAMLLYMIMIFRIENSNIDLSWLAIPSKDTMTLCIAVLPFKKLCYTIDWKLPNRLFCSRFATTLQRANTKLYNSVIIEECNCISQIQIQFVLCFNWRKLNWKMKCIDL